MTVLTSIRVRLLLFTATAIAVTAAVAGAGVTVAGIRVPGGELRQRGEGDHHGSVGTEVE